MHFEPGIDAASGRWVTLLVSLHQGFSPDQILVPSVRLNGIGPPTKIGNGARADELKLRFPRSGLDPAVGILELTGRVVGCRDTLDFAIRDTLGADGRQRADLAGGGCPRGLRAAAGIAKSRLRRVRSGVRSAARDGRHAARLRPERATGRRDRGQLDAAGTASCALGYREYSEGPLLPEARSRGLHGNTPICCCPQLDPWSPPETSPARTCLRSIFSAIADAGRADAGMAAGGACPRHGAGFGARNPM